jgi:hypothetical protein
MTRGRSAMASLRGGAAGVVLLVFAASALIAPPSSLVSATTFHVTSTAGTCGGQHDDGTIYSGGNVLGWAQVTTHNVGGAKEGGGGRGC